MSLFKASLCGLAAVALGAGMGLAHDSKHKHGATPIGNTAWNCVNESDGPLPSGCASNLHQPQGAPHNPTIVYVTGTERRAGRQEFHWQQK